MKFKSISVVLIILLFTLPVAADSLWSDETADMYKDHPQHKVGDIITVVISEEASAVQSANTSTSQSTEVDAEAGTGFLDFLTSFGFGYSDSGSADGSTERSGTLEANITTRITDVLPDGNLRIMGNKRIEINGEEQIIKLSGIIRAEDVEIDNTISSQKIANADIEYEGKGTVADKQEPGLLERLFNWIF